MRSRISLVLGLLLALGAFVALFVMGQVLNPSPYQVVIAVREVAPGQPLTPDMVSVDAQSVNAKVANEYILKDELPDYAGATIVQPLHPGQPLMHAHLVKAGNPAAERRLSLTMEDGNMTAMVIPVDVERAPQDIRAGDRVDILYGIGSVKTTSVGEVQEPAPPAGVELEEEEEESGVAGMPRLASEPTPSPTPQMKFPIAKSAIRNLDVLDAVHDEQPNPAYGGPDSGEPPTIQGELKAIQVAVPREQEELLHFIITTGNYQVALLSPNAPVDDQASLGMTYDDWLAYFWEERDRALSAYTDTVPLVGPGAAAIQVTPAVTPLPAVSPHTPVTGSTTITSETSSAPDETPATPTPAPASDLPTAGEEETSADSEEEAESKDEGGSPASASAGEGDSPEASEETNEKRLGLPSSSLLQGLICGGVGLLILGLIVFAGIRFLRHRRNVTN